MAQAGCLSLYGEMTNVKVTVRQVPTPPRPGPMGGEGVPQGTYTPPGQGTYPPGQVQWGKGGEEGYPKVATPQPRYLPPGQV